MFVIGHAFGPTVPGPAGAWSRLERPLAALQKVSFPAGCKRGTHRNPPRAKGFPKKISIQMITLIALFRLIAMKAKPRNQKERKQPMNPLTQFKKIRILPLLIAPALVALAFTYGRARGRGD